MVGCIDERRVAASNKLNHSLALSTNEPIGTNMDNGNFKMLDTRCRTYTQNLNLTKYCKFKMLPFLSLSDQFLLPKVLQKWECSPWRINSVTFSGGAWLQLTYSRERATPPNTILNITIAL